MRGIARDLNVSRWRVAQVIARQQSLRDGSSDDPIHTELPKPASRRSSKLDQFDTRISQLLARYPNITVTRMLHAPSKGRLRWRRLQIGETYPIPLRG